MAGGRAGAAKMWMMAGVVWLLAGALAHAVAGSRHAAAPAGSRPFGHAWQVGRVIPAAHSARRAGVRASGPTSRLMHYRYLRLRLKADAAPVPVRVWLGHRYWDVLIDEPDTVEEKILDLSAAHNAESFNDIRGVGDIDSLAFDGLLADVTYWFTDLTLLRRHSALATALPAFQDDYRVITVQVDRKPSLELPYYDDTSGCLSLGQLVGRMNASGTGWGYTVEDISGTHPYYNRDRYAAYLEDTFDRDVTDLTVFQARPRFDMVAGYPGIGDPSQPYGAGPFALRFTKRLRGRLDGLVYIRDLTPSGTLHTRVQASGTGGIADTRETDDWRWYRTAPLPAGTYEVVRIDEDGEEWMRGERAVTNRSLSHAHLRAQVIDADTQEPISGAEVVAHLFETAVYGGEDYSDVLLLSATTSASGMYAIPNLDPVEYDVSAVGSGTSEARFPVTMHSALLDIAIALARSSDIAGRVQDADGGAPLPGAPVSVDQAEAPYTHHASAVAGADGAFRLPNVNAYSVRAADRSAYAVWIQKLGYSTRRATPDPEVRRGETADVGAVNLATHGSIRGTVTQGGAPVPGAFVYADQDDELQLGWGGAGTEADGFYAIEGLPAPGAYTVALQVALGGTVVRASAPAAVTAGGVTTVDFALE